MVKSLHTTLHAKTLPRFNGKYLLAVIFILGILSGKLTAQTVQTLTSTQTWVCPTGVYSVQVECWGGGGGGGTASGVANGGSPGGGGGGYAKITNYTVIPGNSYTVTVGTGGSSGVGGNPSWFVSTGTVYAAGGSGATTNGSTGANGGSANVGSTVKSGGNGGNGSSGVGGGGGGGAGDANNGGSGSGTTQGSGGVTGGGNGAAGSTTNANNSNTAGIPGGGGGGARTGPGGAARTGSAGARGQVKLTYTIILCTQPTLQATMNTPVVVSGTSLDLSWTRGTGDNVLIVARTTATTAIVPTYPNSYSFADPMFNNGQNTTGTNNYVVYNGTGTSVTVTGLTAGTSYTFDAYEYMNTGPCYLTPASSAAGTPSACTPPSTQTTGIATNTVTNNSMNLTWTNGNGDRVIVVGSTSGAVSTFPVNGTSYTNPGNPNTSFTGGTSLGANTYVLYEGTGSSLALQNLTPGATYNFAVLSYTSSTNCYNVATGSGNTIAQTILNPMTYTSSTTTQNTATLQPNSTNQQIIGLQVVVGGGSSPSMTMNSITFTTTGSTSVADISNARIFYTGTSSTFATTTQFGSTVANPSGSHTVTPGSGTTLSVGTNYFWIAYDIAATPTATVGDVVDATISSFNITAYAGTSSQTPSTTAPAGSRAIQLTYCTPTFTFGANTFGNDFWITSVSFGTLSYTGGTALSSSPYYVALGNTGNVTAGLTYNLTVTRNGNLYNDNMSAWVDWNNDGDFADGSERLLNLTNSSGGSNTYTASNITIPAVVGTRRMRVMVNYSGAGGSDGCTPNAQSQGETKDFNITVLAGCTAPSTLATAFTFANTTTSSTDISFTRGDGTGGVLVVARPNATAASAPLSGTAYSSPGPSTVYNNGQSTTGTNNFIVYNGAGNGTGAATTPITITGLSAGVTYAFDMYEYNATGTCYAAKLTGTVIVNTPCTGTPAVGSSSAGASSVCPNGSTTLTNTASNPGYSGITFQWQVSTTGGAGTFSNVTQGTGATTQSYNTGALANATGSNITYYYQCVVGCQASGLSATAPASGGVAVTVVGSPLAATINSVAGPVNVCSGTTVNLGASGAASYSWTSSPAGFTSSSASPTATPTVTTTYTVSNTVSGCTFTKSVIARILSASVTPSSATINTGANTSLTVSSADNAGTITYGWNPCSSLSSATAATVTATPLAATTYSVTAFDVNGCTATATAAVNVKDPGIPSSGATTVSAGYSHSLSGSGSFTSTSGGTNIAGNSGMANANYTVDLSATTFTFNFLGTIYNKFGVNTNGFIWLGTTAPPANTTTPISSSAGMAGVISAFANSNQLQGNGSGSLDYILSGSAPNRKLVINWSNIITQFAGSNPFRLQIVLHEDGSTNSNRIEFIYGDNSGNFGNCNGDYQVGLRGATNADFYNFVATTAAFDAFTATKCTQGVTNTDVVNLGNGGGYIVGNSTITLNPSCSAAQTVITPSGTTNLCPSGSVNLTASAGSSYQWYLNGSAIPGPTGTAQTLSNITTAGTYVARTINGGGCGIPSYITAVTTNSSVTPSVTITSNPSPLCNATSATFTATPTNSGCVPTYQWKLNGSTVTGIALNTTTYTNNTLNVNDEVEVVMTSNALCVTSNPVTSNKLTNVTVCSSTWTGATSNDWHTGSNWSPAGEPNSCAATVIINSGSPVISTQNISVGDITLGSGATLTLNGQNLNVCGTWTGSGNATQAAVVGSGTTYINSGSGAQTIGGYTKFDILQINNAAGVILASGANVAVNTGLHLQSGVLNVTNGTLRLLSTAANHNAYIDNFSFGGTPGSISGNVTVDRFVPVVGRNQHFISSPVSTPALSQLGASGPDGSFVTPTPDCDELRSAAGTPYGSVFTYVDGHMPQGGCMLGNWRVTSAGNMANGKGYSTYLTGNSILSLTGEANITDNVDVTGLNNSGYDSVQTKQGQWIESGWNLVGNPFPSAISLTQARVPDGFQNQVQIWKTSGPFAGSWQAAVITQNTIVIPPFQAFMVRTTHASTGNHTYPFLLSERVRNNTQAFYRGVTENSLTLEVDYNGVKDMTNIAFNPEATTNFDDEFDANKYNGGAGRPTLYTTMGTNKWYSINTIPSLIETTTVPVGLRPEVNGLMVISAQGIETFDPTTYIVLEDKQTGTWHNLRNGAYSFTANKADAHDRFVLHFTAPAQILTSDASCDMPGQVDITQPGSTNWNYTLTDAANTATIAKGVVNQYSPVSVSVNAGDYLLTLSDNIGYAVVKNVNVAGLQQVKANFTANTNAALVDEDITFSSTSGDMVTSNSWDFGDGTHATGQTATHSYLNEGVYNVSLNVANAEGCSSTSSRTVTVTSRSTTTGIDELNNKSIQIWSNDNRVFVDFSKQGKVEAEIEIYNVIGQLLNREKFGKSTIYSREINNTGAAYIIVKVKNGDEVTTKKLFVANK